ncbi:hypothetical protein [Streptomyces sp. enrichment culture]|uniref:hypothetical protein n=1 Tax=Streptomyces sp. enrichment culture TaxID=1795815 RepID=UPI003F563ECD
MEPGVKGVAGGQIDQADVGRAGPIPLAPHDAAQVVLADQGQAAAELLPDADRDGRLARGAVAAQHDQPGFFGAHHHGGHATGRPARRGTP